MEVRLATVTPDKRNVIENLCTYYIYDMSEFTQWNPDENGHYPFPKRLLKPYWHEPQHIAYFILVDGDIAGFLLLRKYPSEPTVWDIGQFFVMRKFKGRGVGKRALNLAVALHPGKWQIRVLQDNHGALKFWRAAVISVVDEDFSFTIDKDDDLEMHFFRFSVESPEMVEQ